MNPTDPPTVDLRLRGEEPEIPPALTAEEWARMPDCQRDNVDAFLRRQSLVIAWGSSPGEEWEVPAALRHALAALALHGQPYGFTAADVAMIGSAAEAYRRGDVMGWGPEDGEARARELDHLADRLAALLPPREGA